MPHYKVMLTLRTLYVSGVEGVLAVDPMDYVYVPNEEDYFTESSEDEFLVEQIRWEQENRNFYQYCESLYEKFLRVFSMKYLSVSEYYMCEENYLFYIVLFPNLSFS